MANSLCKETSSLTDLLECSLCRCVLEEPVSLKCLHTFCTKCLDHYIASNKRGTLINCPLCRNCCSTADLVKDFFKIKLLDFHKQNKVTRCSTHSSEIVIRFCFVCMKSLCYECIMQENHLQHRVEKFEEAENYFRNRFASCRLSLLQCTLSVNSVLKKVQEKEVRETLMLDNLENSIGLQEQIIIDAVRKEKLEILAKIKSARSELINVNAANMKKYLEELQDCAVKFMETINCTPFEERDKKYNQIEQKIKDCVALKDFVIICDDLQLQYQPSSLGSLLGKFSYIFPSNATGYSKFHSSEPNVNIKNSF